jgi:hypothetical protein
MVPLPSVSLRHLLSAVPMSSPPGASDRMRKTQPRPPITPTTSAALPLHPLHRLRHTPAGGGGAGDEAGNERELDPAILDAAPLDEVASLVP